MANCYCECCGTKYPSITSLTNGTCRNHPNGSHKGKHKLYEGSEKLQYFCKNCGTKYPSLTSLTNGTCRNHPNGNHKGKHLPAL
jgi:hypothetical protein